MLIARPMQATISSSSPSSPRVSATSSSSEGAKRAAASSDICRQVASRNVELISAPTTSMLTNPNVYRRVLGKVDITDAAKPIASAMMSDSMWYASACNDSDWMVYPTTSSTTK